MRYYFSSLDTINDSYGYIWSNIDLSLKKTDLVDVYSRSVHGEHIRNVVTIGGIMHFEREVIFPFKANGYLFAYQSPYNIFILSPRKCLCNVEMNMGSLFINGIEVSDCNDIYAPYLDNGRLKLAYTKDGDSFDSIDMRFIGEQSCVYN